MSSLKFQLSKSDLERMISILEEKSDDVDVEEEIEFRKDNGEKVVIEIVCDECYGTGEVETMEQVWADEPHMAPTGVEKCMSCQARKQEG